MLTRICGGRGERNHESPLDPAEEQVARAAWCGRQIGQPAVELDLAPVAHHFSGSRPDDIAPGETDLIRGYPLVGRHRRRRPRLPPDPS